MEPIIKFNNGIQVALCNRCFIIICNVTPLDIGMGYIVSEIRYDHFGDLCTNNKIGDTPPVYCDKCKKLLTYSINE